MFYWEIINVQDLVWSFGGIAVDFPKVGILKYLVDGYAISDMISLKIYQKTVNEVRESR